MIMDDLWQENQRLKLENRELRERLAAAGMTRHWAGPCS